MPLIPLLLAAAQAASPAPSPVPSPGAAHHARPAQDPFRVQPLRGGVHVLHGRGGNVGFLVGADAVVVVDAQFHDLGPGILEKIRSVTDRPVRYLVNTHHHGDHVGGNEAFRAVALILAHDRVRARMLSSPQQILAEHPARVEAARRAGNLERVRALEEQMAWARAVTVDQIAAPVLTYDSELRIHLPGETVQLWHPPPAHTDGDSVVYFEKANVVHMGDLLFHRVIPVIDVRAGGSPRGYLAALERVTARLPPDAIVIPGHGEVTDIGGIQAFRRYIADLLEAARKARAAGRTREQFLAETELPAYRDYGGHADRFQANLAAAWDDTGP